jgi:hypothetical protein
MKAVGGTSPQWSQVQSRLLACCSGWRGLGVTRVWLIDTAQAPAACSWKIAVTIARYRKIMPYSPPRLDDRSLILDNRRSELLADSDAPSFTPLFAIDGSSVRLFAGALREASTA